MKTIMRTITIGREFGSGGREVGLKVATALNIPFYDKELISLAAEKGEMSPDFITKCSEYFRCFPQTYFKCRKTYSRWGDFRANYRNDGYWC